MLKNLTNFLKRATAEFPPVEGRHSITIDPETQQLQVNFAGYGLAAYLESDSDINDVDATIFAMRRYMNSDEYRQSLEKDSP